VISKGNYRQDIFLGDADRTAYLRKGAHAREMVTYLPGTLAGRMLKDIPEHLRRSPMRISQAILEIEERFRHDESLKVILNRLERDLAQMLKIDALLRLMVS